MNKPGMTLSGMNDIINYLERCKKAVDYLEEKIDSFGVLSFKNKDKNGKTKADYKKQLKSIRNNIEKVLGALIDYSTFDAKLIIPFLCEYLSMTEEENYVALGKVKDPNLPKGYNVVPKVKGVYYNLLLNEKDANELYREKRDGFLTSDSIEELLSGVKGKVAVLENEKSYNLLDGTELDDRFTDFPALLNLAYQLVDLRIKYPASTQEDILNKVIEIMRTRKQEI